MPGKENTENYRELRDKLDDIMSKLSDENVDLDVSIELYKKANEIIIKIEDYLKNAENEIKKLKTQCGE